MRPLPGWLITSFSVWVPVGVVQQRSDEHAIYAWPPIEVEVDFDLSQGKQSTQVLPGFAVSGWKFFYFSYKFFCMVVKSPLHFYYW